MKTTTARTTSLCVFALCMLAASSAAAESGDWNLHLDVGLGPAIIGPFSPPGTDGRNRLTLAGWASVDYKVSEPWAIELMLGLGNQFELSEEVSRTGDIYYAFAFGARVRPFDDEGGYLDDPGGNSEGNFWLSGHLGYHYFDTVQFGVDVAAGYEFSAFYPVQIGLFTRMLFLLGGRNEGVDGALFFGLNASFDLVGRDPPPDTDEDGLPDFVEEEGDTDLNRADTDLDGLEDGLEVNNGTNPHNRDTDGDGLEDGREDANHNGRLDDGETDPRNRDTDGGGIPDSDEIYDTHLDPRDPSDDDRDSDHVADTRDQCPDTAEGTEVDDNGCAVVRERMELAGVLFGSGSAEILPESTPSLERALQVLVDNPDALIEVAGHTDAVGRPGPNRRLSLLRAQAVRRWLMEHGVAGYRMTARGYGADEPVAPNDTEEGRAQNRRIEIRSRR